MYRRWVQASLQRMLGRVLRRGRPVGLVHVAQEIRDRLDARWVELSFQPTGEQTLRTVLGHRRPEDPVEETVADWPGHATVQVRWQGGGPELDEFSNLEALTRLTLVLGCAGGLADQQGDGFSPPLEALVELAGAAAHELNQPLTSLLGHVELARRKLDLAHPIHAHLDAVQREADRMSEVVNKLAHMVRYRTKPYLGASDIVDLDAASEEDVVPPAHGE